MNEGDFIYLAGRGWYIVGSQGQFMPVDAALAQLLVPYTSISEDQTTFYTSTGEAVLVQNVLDIYEGKATVPGGGPGELPTATPAETGTAGEVDEETPDPDVRPTWWRDSFGKYPPMKQDKDPLNQFGPDVPVFDYAKYAALEKLFGPKPKVPPKTRINRTTGATEKWDAKTGQYVPDQPAPGPGQVREPYTDPTTGRRYKVNPNGSLGTEIPPAPGPGQVREPYTDSVTGRRYEVNPDGSLGIEIQPAEPQQLERPNFQRDAGGRLYAQGTVGGGWTGVPSRSLDDLMADAFIAGDRAAAQAIFNFQKQPTEAEALRLAMDIAASPGDYLIYMGMASGEIPVDLGDGSFRRIVPLSNVFGKMGLGATGTPSDIQATGQNMRAMLQSGEISQEQYQAGQRALQSRAAAFPSRPGMPSQEERNIFARQLPARQATAETALAEANLPPPGFQVTPGQSNIFTRTPADAASRQRLRDMLVADQITQQQYDAGIEELNTSAATAASQGVSGLPQRIQVPGAARVPVGTAGLTATPFGLPPRPEAEATKEKIAQMLAAGELTSEQAAAGTRFLAPPPGGNIFDLSGLSQEEMQQRFGPMVANPFDPYSLPPAERAKYLDESGRWRPGMGPQPTIADIAAKARQPFDDERLFKMYGIPSAEEYERLLPTQQAILRREAELKGFSAADYDELVRRRRQRKFPEPEPVGATFYRRR